MIYRVYFQGVARIEAIDSDECREKFYNEDFDLIAYNATRVEVVTPETDVFHSQEATP